MEKTKKQERDYFLFKLYKGGTVEFTKKCSRELELLKFDIIEAVENKQPFEELEKILNKTYSLVKAKVTISQVRERETYTLYKFKIEQDINELKITN